MIHFVRRCASFNILTKLSEHSTLNRDSYHLNEYLESSFLMTSGIESIELQCYFRFINLNEMITLNHDISRLRIEKKIIWLVTIALMIAGLPALKAILVFILEKLYELFVQHGMGR